MQNANTYRLQIIYTQINRTKTKQPAFKNYYFNYDPDLYYNPASTVKMPLAFLALEKLNKMKSKDVNKYTSMQFDSSYEKQSTQYKDSTSENQLPSIAHYIKKAFLISDNDAYNRLYQFTGQQTIHRSLKEKGYLNIRIPRQFMGFTTEQNRHSNPIRFIHQDGSLIYAQPAAYNTDSFDFSHAVKIGKAYLNRNDSLVNEPFDFTVHNNLPLEAMQQLLQSVMFPTSVPEKQRFDLSKDDYHFLHRYLSQYPSETSYPKYDDSVYYDSYVKFFFRDSTHKMPAHIRVFNKVGWAYGFLTDISYVTDFKNKVEYMLTATLYVNKDEVLNDNKYEYETTGWPFLNQLGQRIYQYELRRERKYKPDLSAFKIQYDKRDVNDRRASIKDADN
ncbi:MAG: serine hydrolase [Chitinophagaceae bacterium]|nr:serine hydrolase [Chitinophagaceae bacterium]